MQTPKPVKGSLATSLIGRKARCKIGHLWFGRQDKPAFEYFDKPLPTDEGTIVAVFTSRQDGSTELKAMVESETGELMEFYVEHINLVPVSK